MKYTQLKHSISEGANSIYLLEGDDAYFRMKGEEQIKLAFLQMPELNYSSFDGETLKGGALSSLVAAIKNYPFMAEKRIIKVTEFYPSESEYETYLKSLFDDFPSSSILIIVNTGAKKGVDLKRKKSVAYVDCSKTEPDAVSKWVYITLKRAGIAASAAVCESVAEYCLHNMARVSVEVEKIIAYKGGGTLMQNEVDELVFRDADYRIYELTNAISRKNYCKFCEIAAELLIKSGDEMTILSGLFSYFKNLSVIVCSKDSVSSLAAMMKMKEYAVKKSMEQADAIGEKIINETLSYLYSVVSEVKSGRLTPKSALQNAENFIFFSN